MMTQHSYDYIIIGSGSGGGVMAARLSEDPDAKVLLVEAGSARRALSIAMPAMLFLNFARPRYNWAFETSPQPGLLGRKIFQPRGKALGGSSAINAMVYMRGHAEDFNGWARRGAEGWDYASVLPYFKRAEAYGGGGDPLYRGSDGPVGTGKAKIWAPVQDAFMAAGRERGYPETNDPNGLQQEGFSLFDLNVRDGVRASTAQAYIGPASKRPNLTIAANTLCARIEMTGTRASGVLLTTGTKSWRAGAACEVIVCAGAAKTPQLLMLSGIGAPEKLAPFGITPSVSLPGVGANLQDHVELHLRWLCTKPVAYNRFVRPDRAIFNGLQWLLTKRGICTTNGFECGAVLRSAENVPYPDQLIHYYPVHLNGWKPDLKLHGFTLGLNYMRCASRGEIRLRSADHRDAPEIDPNYLSDPDDLDKLVRFTELGHDLAQSPAYDDIRGECLTPLPPTRAAREHWVREHLESAYHLAGTCRMGSDPLAVTDSYGRVHGATNLRVVDASLMPLVTNANLNAPIMMMAERIADHVRGRAFLPPEPAPWAGPVAGGAGRF